MLGSRHQATTMGGSAVGIDMGLKEPQLCGVPSASLLLTCTRHGLDEDFSAYEWVGEEEGRPLLRSTGRTEDLIERAGPSGTVKGVRRTRPEAEV